MLNKEPLFTIISKPKWEWYKVNSQLRTSIKGRQATFSLQPNLTFQKKDFNGSSTKLQLRVCIDTQKSLKYENQVGWNWHKSSNIPLISLKVQLRTPDTNLLLPLPENLKVKIFIVEVISNILGRQKISYLQDVGIRGENQMKIKDGYAVFNGIKFITTSYKNQGVKFHLLLVIYVQDQSKQQEFFSHIVFSAISSPVFVDSRKSARDYQEKRFLSFVEIFDPLFMNKQFSKKLFMLKGEFQTKINNSIQGLFNYLTASNIHYKVKHPIFLSVKFSKVFHILFNKNHSFFRPKTLKLSDILFKLQKCLIKQFGRKSQKLKIKTKNNKLFIICVISSQQCKNYKKSKIFQCLEFLHSKNIQFTKSENDIHDGFSNIFQLGDVAKTYVSVYEQLAEMTNKEIDNRNYADLTDKEENKIQSSQQKNIQKIITDSNSSPLFQNQQQVELKFPESQIQPLLQINKQKQVFQKQNIANQNFIEQNYKKANIVQPQLIHRITEIINPYFSENYHPNYHYPIYNQFHYLNYCNPLVNQIKYQNNMLEAIIKENIMMRQNLLWMMMEKQNKEQPFGKDVKIAQEYYQFDHKRQVNCQQNIQFKTTHHRHQSSQNININDHFLKFQH